MSNTSSGPGHGARPIVRTARLGRFFVALAATSLVVLVADVAFNLPANQPWLYAAIPILGVVTMCFLRRGWPEILGVALAAPFEYLMTGLVLLWIGYGS